LRVADWLWKDSLFCRDCLEKETYILAVLILLYASLAMSHTPRRLAHPLVTPCCFMGDAALSAANGTFRNAAEPEGMTPILPLVELNLACARDFVLIRVVRQMH